MFLSNKVIVVTSPLLLVVEDNIDFHLVPKEPTQTGEPLEELGAFG